MKRHLAAAAALALLALPAALVAPGAQAARAQAPAPAASSGGVQSFGACLSSGGKGDLLLLVDQSASLRRTDPNAVRVRAATYLLEQLAASTSAGRLDVQVAVAGFDVDYEPVVPWTALTPGAVPALTRQVQAFAQRSDGLDTDYVNALQGTRSELLGRARAGRTCQAVLWFTDGRYDVEQRDEDVATDRKRYAPDVALDSEDGAREAERRGRATLCRSGGLADQLRAAGTSVVAVGLGDADSFGLLRGVALGEDECGDLPARGDVALAGELDGLFPAVDVLADPGRPPVVITDGLCSRTPCTQKHRVVLDLSVRAVHVLADAGRPGVRVRLDGPGPAGPAVFAFTPGAARTVQVDGQRVTARWLSQRSLDLTLTRTRGDTWPGLWSVVFVEPSARPVQGVQTRSQLRITGDLVPAVAGVSADTPLRLPVGSAREVTVLLRSEVTGRDVAPSSVQGTAVVSAVLRPTVGEAVRVGTGDLVPARPARLDLTDVAPGGAVLRARLALRTRGVPGGAPGTQLADRVVEVPVVLVPPPQYPTVADRADLGSTDGGTVLRGTIGVTGPGCVWLDEGSAASTTLPDGSRRAVVASSKATSARACQELAEGEQAELPVSATLDAPGNGSLNATVVVQALPGRASTEPVIGTPVTLVGEAARPVDTSTRLVVFLLLLLGGLGLPVAFLYAAKWWTARIPGLPLLAGTVPVRRDGTQVLRDGAPLRLHPQDVHYVQVPRDGVRTLAVPGTDVVLRTTLGARPAAPGEVRVETARHAVSGSPGSRRVKGQLRLPLTVHGTWIALAPSPGSDDVDLLLLVAGTADAGAYERAARSVVEQLPRQLDLLQAEGGTSSAGGTGPAGPSSEPPPAAGAAWDPPPAAGLSTPWDAPAAAPAPWDAAPAPAAAPATDSGQGTSTAAPPRPPAAPRPVPMPWDAPAPGTPARPAAGGGAPAGATSADSSPAAAPDAPRAVTPETPTWDFGGDAWDPPPAR